MSSQADDLQLAETISDACARRDADALRPHLAPAIEWLHYGERVAAGAGAAEQIIADLTKRDSRLTLKDLAWLRNGLAAARFEGNERLATGSIHAGTRYWSFEIAGGQLARSDVFGYRKNLLAQYGVTLEQADGALRVRDEGDDRLHRLQDAGQDYGWRRYAGEDHAHCAICWQTFAKFDRPAYRHEGYVSTATRHEQWLCHECLDEICEHFAIRVTGGPLGGLDAL